jgi:large subunit ribosomal protein L18e
MTKSIDPTDPMVIALLSELKKHARDDVKVWKALYRYLSKPRRQRPVVNLSKVNRHCKDGDLVVIPGKVLSSGDINCKVRVAALSFSERAVEKIRAVGGECMTIEELLKTTPEGKGIKIIA